MRPIALAGLLWVAAVAATASQSRTLFPGTLDQHPAIDYRSGAVADPITVLQRRMAAGDVSLEFEGGGQGFLRSLLATLNVPAESQLLLFSKTGIQHPFTNPENPRALYFNDRVILGYIPGAPVIEVAAHDPTQGIIFQTLPQDPRLGSRAAVRAARSLPDVPSLCEQSRRARHSRAQHVYRSDRPDAAAAG